MCIPKFLFTDSRFLKILILQISKDLKDFEL